MDSMCFKTVLTLVILLTGGIAITIIGVGDSVSEYQSEGVVIDFKQWDVKWTDVDLEENGDAMDALKYACEYNAYELVVSPEGSVISIDRVINDETHAWGLWVIVPGETTWKELPSPYDYDLSDYVVSSWAYRAGGEKPTIAIDSAGSSIYGYPQKSRTVSLAPSITETVASVGGVKTLVGTDLYSNYPKEVVTMKANGDISIVGDYTTPNYEEILKTDPDVVFCDGSQYNHIQLIDRLKAVDICAVLLYGGENIETILDNIFIVGQVMGYDIGAAETIKEVEYAIDQMEGVLRESQLSTVVDSMISLSGDMSPWVSGSYTYADDILVTMYGDNVFEDMNGWVHVNSEQVILRNPSIIIILTTEYAATQGDYDLFLSSLSSEWKATDAYKNGEIYLITEGAGEMAQRPGPRFAQFSELTARILNPDVFDDLEISKFIGDNYTDYLTYTKTLGYG